jgi:hypothetical protein
MRVSGQIPTIDRSWRPLRCVRRKTEEKCVEKVLLALLPTLMVVGGLYWTMTMGMREQEDADRFTEEWMKRNGKM